jgi:bacteriocin biosynthesis cyclodehydratase domain-containing protein
LIWRLKIETKQKYRIKPYVILSRRCDGSIRFCFTYKKSYLLPKAYSSIFDQYIDSILSENPNNENLVPSDILKKIKLLRNDLIAVGILERAPDINQTISEKYKSQMTFFSIFDGTTSARYDYQQKLLTSKIAILGMGGVGSHVAVSLLSAGVGFLKIMDYDKIEASNLNRQFIYKETDIGKLKTRVARERLIDFNPLAKIHAINRKVKSSRDLIDLVEGVDFFVCAADYPFHYIYRWVNDVCVKKRVPWIQANSAEATGFVGPLVVPGKTSCYGCIESVWKKKNPNYLYEIDVLNKDETLYHGKSSTLGSAIGIIGNFTALEIIKHITGFTKPATLNCQLSLDFGDLTLNKQRFRKIKDCPICGSIRK